MNIFKYALKKHIAVQVVEMPRGAKILTAQMQYGVLCVWAIIDPGNEIVRRLVSVIGTGNNCGFACNEQYIATVQDGSYVWHVFIDN